MDFDFSIFEKLKEIYNGIRRLAFGMVAVVGTLAAVVWSFIDWAAARAVSMINWIAGFVPDVELNLATVGLDWARINQWVPVDEALAMGHIFLTLAGVMILVNLLKRFLPLGG